MSLHFIIDGYNLIRQTDLIHKIKTDDSRVSLIRFLCLKRPQGSVRNPVTVVFDGAPGNFYTRAISGIKVLFSFDDSADNVIRGLLERSRVTSQIVVVSNDREVRECARVLGAGVKSIEEFLEKFLKKKSPQGQDEEMPLAPDVAGKITDELKKKWLKE